MPGASTSTLSARLDELVDAGLLDRERYAEIPPRVEYELTDDGAELAERLRPVAEWTMRTSSSSRSSATSACATSSAPTNTSGPGR
ncbi:MAG: winged helix-turn-helix transcriptional regulator [Verrucomicrobiota bacterium]